MAMKDWSELRSSDVSHFGWDTDRFSCLLISNNVGGRIIYLNYMENSSY